MRGASEDEVKRAFHAGERDAPRPLRRSNGALLYKNQHSQVTPILFPHWYYIASVASRAGVFVQNQDCLCGLRVSESGQSPVVNQKYRSNTD